MQRAAYDGLRLIVKFIFSLWPLWLFWFASAASEHWYFSKLLPTLDPTSKLYHALVRMGPSASLLGPINIALVACALRGGGMASRRMAVASIAGLAVAIFLVLFTSRGDLISGLGQRSPIDRMNSAVPALVAFVFGLAGIAIAQQLAFGNLAHLTQGGSLRRARSDNHGHAHWLSIGKAQRLFPGPDPQHGGIVVGEAYRVDEDPLANRRFDPEDPRSWGQGGRARLLIDPCHEGSTHALVIAGSGGFKTSGTGAPTLLTWTGSAVVLDPARELGPMVGGARRRDMGQRVITLDPSDPDSDGFNVLDWIDPGQPAAETNVEAVATWLSGEPNRGSSANSTSEFFHGMGRQLIACLLADLLWTGHPETHTLSELRRRLVTPEDEMRALLGRIHSDSASSLARQYAATLKDLVPETFSGVYANAALATRWLSTAAYANLVSGRALKTRDLVNGDITVFVQIPLKTLEATPGLGRVIIGSLLNAVYEADGQHRGRVLFLLDEAARLGPMSSLESARDAGRKYGITLLLLYQSVGQLIEQWGKDGARAWYDSVSWRLYAAVSDPETARELSAVCGEYGVMATTQGDTSSTRGLTGGAYSSGRSENRSEIKRALIKPDEVLHDVRADEAFVIRRGARPIRCGRAIYFRRPDMIGRVYVSRFHA